VISKGFSFPETSLTQLVSVHQWGSENNSYVRAQYGHILQFFYYLQKHCGGREIFFELLENPSEKTGVDFIEEVLHGFSNLSPVCQDFDVLFQNFQKARFFPDIYPKTSYLIRSRFRGRVQSEPLESMKPYSAQAHPLRDEEKCSGEAVRFEHRLYCLQVRFE